MRKTPSWMAGAALLALAGTSASQEAAHEVTAREILAELVATNTAPSGGPDLRPAVQALANRLKNAGFGEKDLQVVGESPELGNLVVRYRSPEPRQRPLLLMAHLDVVEALPEDWTVDPYELTEMDGWYYGRGTTDNKAGAAILVANFIRLKHEGYEPDRDLIVMLTADEETTGAGARYLVNQRRDLIDAEFALNSDGGGVMLDEGGGDPVAFVVQTSEKVYVSFTLTATDPGGHSSVPRPDNAISRIARTLVALEDYDFPVNFNETSRAFFRLSLPMLPAEVRPVVQGLLRDPADPGLSARLVEWPYYNALARTTCVATRLEAGHAENALPQTARAVVNCRVLPQDSVEKTRNRLAELAGPNEIVIEQVAEALVSPPSPLAPSVFDPIADVAEGIWGELPVIPEMSTGATDGLFVRNGGIPVYAVSAIAEDPGDIRAHGQDERIRKDAYYDALEFWYRITKRLSGGG